MISRFNTLPLFLQFVVVMAVSMLVPALYGLALEHHTVARNFFYACILLLIGVALIGIAMSDRTRAPSDLDHLLSLFGAFTILPAMIAVPFAESLPDTGYFNAYFEMVSSLTTTGATLFDAPERLSPALHLWRAQVAWLGGLLMWVAAAAVLSPLNLGGFEVTARADKVTLEGLPAQMAMATPRKRWQKAVLQMTPIYAGLTLILWVLLMMSGDASIVGLTHAMSTMSTSGISAVGGVPSSGSGLAGELCIFLFFVFALSRLTFWSQTGSVGRQNLPSDPEFRLAIILAFGIPILLFLRHWVGAYEVEEQENLFAGLRALWGALFTVMSFLTTTGFESSDWAAARGWSGLGTPGLILMGVAVIGGGVATTAGGVKLLRVFALYLNGLREMEKLVHPSSVSGSGNQSRWIRRKGAVIAWVFFMLFAMSLAGVSMILAVLGVDFEQALVLSIAALSTTGPLVQTAADHPVELIALAPSIKAVLCGAMVLGRLEALAVIALISPELWRN